MFPRWLPLYLLAIAMLTLFPFTNSQCSEGWWRISTQPSDMLANILLFMPIGVALRAASLPRMFTFALALSLAIEFSQLWLPRSPDITDLVMNTAGAGIGHQLARGWLARWDEPLMRPVTRRLVLRTATLLALGTMVGQALLNPANDFSNWTSLPLVLGNEPSGSRPWIGEISELAFFDRALRPGEHTEVQSLDEPSPEWSAGGPIAWLELRGERPIARIDGPDGPQEFEPRLTPVSAPPRGNGGLWLTAAGAVVDPRFSEHVIERLRETGELTLDVRLRPISLHQRGPARIVAISSGEGDQNLMLGQRASSLMVRLTTPATGAHGKRHQLVTRRRTLTGREQYVRLSYNGHDAKLWVDSKCASGESIALNTALPFLAEPLGVMIVLCTSLTAIAAASFLPRGRRRLRIALALACGAGGWSLLLVAGAWDHVYDFDASAMLLGVLALATTVPVLRNDLDAEAAATPAATPTAGAGK